ncbi:MAG: methylenetetrahydrofolate reductase, partial [Lysobacterales bacterium]
MKNRTNNGNMSRLLDQAYLEVMPSGTILDRLVHIPRHCFVAVTCSPKNGLEPTLDLVEKLKALPEERQLRVIPHIAARTIRDKCHLREILARLEAAGVESIFVPGGDAPVPVGAYDNALQVLHDMAEIGHHFEDVGIAAYPEGHPKVSDESLLWFLKEKQQYATYAVTQMCFDPQILVSWLRGIRKAGVSLPVWIGLPGVADMSKLLALSIRIGVGQSLRLLDKHKGLLRRVFNNNPFAADALLEGLGPQLDDPDLIVPGFHLFSFNNVERTEQW